MAPSETGFFRERTRHLKAIDRGAVVLDFWPRVRVI